MYFVNVTVRSATIRKRGKDGKPFTPTEQRKRDQLMRQFLHRDGQQGNSPEYIANYDAIDWSKG